jgi:hypothetical protein
VASGTSSLDGVACASDTACVAVGDDPQGLGVVMPIANGTPGAVRVAFAATRLLSVACTTTTTCMAVGYTPPNLQGQVEGVVQPITREYRDPALGCRGLPSLGLACTSPTSCVAVGSSPSGKAVVVPVTNGSPGVVHVVAGTSLLDGVACLTPVTCVAVGSSDFNQGVVVLVASGVPEVPRAVFGTSRFSGVACPTVNRCEVVGQKGTLGTLQAVVVPLTDGTPGAAQVVSGTDQLAAVACPSATVCESVGANAPASGIGSPGHGMVLLIDSGGGRAGLIVPGAFQVLNLSCPGTTACEAVGTNSGDPSSSQGMVMTIAPSAAHH